MNLQCFALKVDIAYTYFVEKFNHMNDRKDIKQRPLNLIILVTSPPTFFFITRNIYEHELIYIYYTFPYFGTCSMGNFISAYFPKLRKPKISWKQGITAHSIQLYFNELFKYKEGVEHKIEVISKPHQIHQYCNLQMQIYKIERRDNRTEMWYYLYKKLDVKIEHNIYSEDFSWKETSTKCEKQYLALPKIRPLDFYRDFAYEVNTFDLSHVLLPALIYVNLSTHPEHPTEVRL